MNLPRRFTASYILTQPHLITRSRCHLPVAILPTSSAEAKKEKPTYIMVNEEFGLPVFPYDITDRPYDVFGEVRAGVRKATLFSKAPSQAKIYKELWERAE